MHVNANYTNPANSVKRCFYFCFAPTRSLNAAVVSFVEAHNDAGEPSVDSACQTVGTAVSSADAAAVNSSSLIGCVFCAAAVAACCFN